MFKVVIPVAGLGTRSLPASKVVPKEMLPVFDRPIIQYIVEEAVESEANGIVLVSSPGKNIIEDHFRPNAELESKLEAAGKFELLKILRAVPHLPVKRALQMEARGLGHAVLCAREWINEDYFAVMLGDELLDANPGALSQMQNFLKTHRLHEKKAGVVMLMSVNEADVSKYGICECDPGTGQVMRAIEKPKASETPSRLAIIGRYLLPKDTFDKLAAVKPGAAGEIQLTDALQALAREGRLFGTVLKGLRFDAGDRLGFLKANLHYYLKSSLQEDVRKCLNSQNF